MRGEARGARRSARTERPSASFEEQRRLSRPRARSSARSFLFTILGQYVYPMGGSAWTEGFVRALATLGLEEAATRQALTRAASRGILTKERVGRRVRWAMTEISRRNAAAAQARLPSIDRSVGDWDGRWLLVLVSVPEEGQGVWHKLRRNLTFAGFGALGPGLWVSPDVRRESEARRILAELDLLERATSLSSRILSIGDERRLARAWDLEGLDRRYRAFVAEFGRLRPKSDEEVFVAQTRLVHEWRRFVFDDPGLPEPLLPANWSGKVANRLFHECSDRWDPVAKEWFFQGER